MTESFIRNRRSKNDPSVIQNYTAARGAFSWDSVAGDLGIRLEGPWNLGELALRAPAERPALLWYGARGEEEQVSYGELRDTANRFANTLKKLGAKRGDRILFLARALPEVAYGVLGSLLFGAVPCVLSLQRSPEYVRNVASKTGANVVVIEPESKRLIDPLRKELPDLQTVLVLQRATLQVKMGAGDVFWNDHIPSASAAFDPIPCAPQDPAFLHYTDLGMSGAVSSHMAAPALRSASHTALDLREGDRCLFLAHPGDMHFVPFALLAPFLVGATQILLEDPIHFYGYAGLSASGSVSVWYSSFSALEVLLRNNPSVAELLRNVRHIAVVHPVDEGFVRMTEESYGSPIHGVWWERQFGSIVLAEFPGLDLHPGSLGRPLLGVETTVFGSDNKPDKSGTVGRLAVRLNPGIPFGGFWHDPGQTKKSVEEGWFVTSQAVRFDSDGICWPMTIPR